MLKTGKCPHGKECKFDHNPKLLAIKSTNACRHIVNNEPCPYGTDCKYSHDPTVCNAARKNKGKSGSKGGGKGGGKKKGGKGTVGAVVPVSNSIVSAFTPPIAAAVPTGDRQWILDTGSGHDIVNFRTLPQGMRKHVTHRGFSEDFETANGKVAVN